MKRPNGIVAKLDRIPLRIFSIFCILFTNIIQVDQDGSIRGSFWSFYEQKSVNFEVGDFFTKTLLLSIRHTAFFNRKCEKNSHYLRTMNATFANVRQTHQHAHASHRREKKTKRNERTKNSISYWISLSI